MLFLAGCSKPNTKFQFLYAEKERTPNSSVIYRFNAENGEMVRFTVWNMKDVPEMSGHGPVNYVEVDQLNLSTGEIVWNVDQYNRTDSIKGPQDVAPPHGP